MRFSEQINELAKALSQFQQKVSNPKNVANNPFFNSKYAPLDEVISVVKEPLAEQGLSFIQSTSSDQSTGSITLTTLLMHSSGQWIESDQLSLKADKNNAQSYGSALTYARRYQLSAMLGVASEDDDDANTPTHGASTPEEAKKVQAEQAKPIEADQAKKIREIARQKGISEGYICKFRGIEKFEELGKKDYESAMEWLLKKPNKQ